MNVKTQIRAHLDIIREGAITERYFNKGDSYITLSFQMPNDDVTDVKFEIEWIATQDGYHYNLTACDAIYWMGLEKCIIEDLWKNYKDVAEIAQTKASQYIDLIGALEQEQFDREDDALNYWGDF